MPIKVIPSGESLGATVEGLDLARLSDADADAVVQALGRHGVIRFPDQSLTAADLKNFSARLGDLEILLGGAHAVEGAPRGAVVVPQPLRVGVVRQPCRIGEQPFLEALREHGKVFVEQIAGACPSRQEAT